MALPDDVRATCAQIAQQATSVRVDVDTLGSVIASRAPAPPALDPERHFLEGAQADVATYLLTLDSINFGSGWWPTLRKREVAGRPLSGYFTVASGLADRFRAHGPWSNAQLRALRADELADVLGQARDHELMALYAQALRQLGSWRGERRVLDVVGTSAVGLATDLARLSLWADRGFYKRAQIVASD